MDKFTSFLIMIMEIVLRVLDKLDKKKSDDFRSRLSSDPVSVFLNQVKGDESTRDASSVKRN